MKILLYLFIIFFNSLYSQDQNLRIYTSRDLKGNVKSCLCTTVPIAGMMGRASFLQSEKIDPKKDILIELGDYLGTAIPMDKYPAIFEGFLAMGYHFLGISEQELKNTSKDSWQKYYFSPVSSNLNYKDKILVLNEFETVYRYGKTVSFLSIIFPSKFEKIGDTYTKELNYIPPQDLLNRLAIEKKSDLWIFSFWGTEKEMEDLNFANSFPNRLVILNLERGVPKEGFKTYKKVGKVYFQGLENGDDINIFEYNKDFKFVKNKKVLLVAENLPENEKISGIVKKYNIK
jgi:hypothetical protein